MIDIDLLIIGGGPAGMSAAVKAKELGINNLLILERNAYLGGILNQCIHNGFGLHLFKEELTGPEYAARFAERVVELQIPYKLNTMVLDISPDKIVTCISTAGVQQYKAKAVILAMGCRERPRGALNIPGSRVSGIYSAGTAQELVNIRGLMPGKEIVILGSGDIGLIMARRMTLSGAKVKCVVELMPYSGGLKRNIAQCLHDFNIPLLLNHTVSKICGSDRLNGVYISEVDENKQPIEEKTEFVSCDTLLLSVGLLPENELSKKAGILLSGLTGGAIVDSSFQTSCDGVFACGNVLHVHDLVDFVTEEAYTAAENSALYLTSSIEKQTIPAVAGDGIRYIVPQNIVIPVNQSSNSNDELNCNVELKFRTDGVYTNCFLSLYIDNERVIKKKKKILTPGEMEKIVLNESTLKKLNSNNEIIVKVEKE